MSITYPTFTDWEWTSGCVHGDRDTKIELKTSNPYTGFAIESDHKHASTFFLELNRRRMHDGGIWSERRPGIVEFVRWAYEFLATMDDEDATTVSRATMDAMRDFVEATAEVTEMAGWFTND